MTTQNNQLKNAESFVKDVLATLTTDKKVSQAQIRDMASKVMRVIPPTPAGDSKRAA